MTPTACHLQKTRSPSVLTMRKTLGATEQADGRVEAHRGQGSSSAVATSRFGLTCSRTARSLLPT